MALRQLLHDQQFVAPIVDDFDGNLLVLARFKRGAGRAGQVVPDTFFVFALERFLQIVPGAGAGKERLRDMETEIVVVGIEKPGRHIITATMCNFRTWPPKPS